MMRGFMATESISYRLVGLESLLAKLESISYDIKRKGGRFALRKAAGIVERALKENARAVDDPKTPADISKNVAVRFSNRTFKTSGDIKFRVGILGGAARAKLQTGLAGGDTRHFRDLEFGTEKMAAQPFMRRALESNIGKATNEFISQYEKALDRAIKRAAKGK